MTEGDVAAIMAALRPVINQAVTDAVNEALARTQRVEAVEGVVESVVGRTVDVFVQGAPMLIPATALSAGIVAGSSVVVFFYGNGRAYAAGPLAGIPLGG